MYKIVFPLISSLTAGCSPPQAPVSGSVSGFTSSRVGAQVTYHCDTALVLVGEMVASCSSPSLQWVPNATDIMCIQTAGIIITTHLNMYVWPSDGSYAPDVCYELVNI